MQGIIHKAAFALFFDAPQLHLLPAASLSCVANCSGHGTCVVAAGTCSCFPGWAGAACEVELLNASCTASCSGHGWCRGALCLCDEWWRGPNCDQPSRCPNGCSGFGHCVDGRYCRCDAEHYGADCSKPRNRGCPGWPRACGGLERGTCGDDGTCACRPAYKGAACELSTAYRACPRNCTASLGHGVCDPEGSGHCLCDPEWEGTACERPAGKLSLPALLLRVVLGLLLTASLIVLSVLVWCMRVRGVRPRDVLRGQWHVRKEEGWRRALPGEIENQMPGARFERFGEWAPPGQPQPAGKKPAAAV